MKNIKEMLRRIGTAGLAAIMLTAQMPVMAFAEEPAAVEQEAAAVKDGEQPAGSGEAVAQKTDSGAAADGADSGKVATAETKNGKAAGEAGAEATEAVDSKAAEKAADKAVSDKKSGGTGAGVEAEKTGDEDEPSAEEEKTGDSEEKRFPAFSESKSIDGVRITVKADEGVFPEGATLSVEKVTLAQEKQAEEAVESERNEDKQVAASYTYDIKVLDKDGNELQPADENGEDSSSRVKVSFKLDEVADENLETNVYHIKEANTENTEGSSTREKGADSENENEGSVDCESDGTDSDDTDSNVTGSETTEFTAEKLPVETDGDTVIAETDGFSLYTVEFTYDSKQYVLPGDSEVALSEVLDTVGLTGEVSAVGVSDESLFSAKKCRTEEGGSTLEKDEDGNPIEDENGTWFVFAHKAFSTEEWMKVTIGGVVYEIVVTDNQTADLTITTINEWKTFARNVASGTDYSGKTVTLGADLDFSGTSFSYEYIVGFLKNDSGYDNGSKSFKGTFDGGGHTIKNVTITANTDVLRVGCLFYKNEGTIRNTVFDNITITAMAQYAGFIAHTNAGTIDGCTISGMMNRDGDVGWMGGVVYTNSGTIHNCYVNVKDPNGSVVNYNGYGTLTNVYCTSDCTGTKQGTVVYKFVAVEDGGILSISPTTGPVCTFGTNKYYTADTEVTFTAEVESDKTANPIYCNGVPVSKNSDGSYTFTVAEEDVKVQTRESLPNHTITCADASGGTITASPSTAHAYEEITLTATPESGYLLNGITATTSDSKSVNVSYEPWYKQINTASFRMPDANVTVTPVFTAINNTSNEFSINLPKSGTETGTIPSGVVSFKVYDHAGASGNYGTYCNGTLTLTAPSGYGFQISGSVDVYGNSLGYQVPVSISDGTNTIYSATRVNTTLSPIICNSNTLTIGFISDYQAFHNDHVGLDLTVSLINLSQTHSVTISSAEHGTMTADVASAKAGTKVTLTAAPATDGNTHYMLEGVSVTYTENDTTKNIAVDGGWWTNNVLTFTMPYSDVVVTPTFVEGNADGGPNINGLTYVGKTDTEQGYYKIDRPTALNALAAYVNGGGRNVDMLFKQTADIDMSGQGYTPIGNNTNNPFNGTYDGDGYVILNLSCTSYTGEGLSGMFGRIANGTVKNVNLKNCNFTGSLAGGIAGYMNGGGTVTNCSVIGGTVSCGANDSSGGIVGRFDAGAVKDCFAANTVSAYSANSGQNGPIVGTDKGTTANNYYTVAVSGGNSTGTQISGGFVTAGEGVTIGSGVFRTIGKTAEHTYYFGEQGDAITFSAEISTTDTGMRKFTTTDGTLGSNAEGKCTLTMPASDVTVSLADVTPTISGIENQTYTGNAIEPTVTVKDDWRTLTAGTDYTVSYSDNTAVGTATVTITGKGKYLGTASTTFEIKKASINPVVSIEGWTYRDTANAPSVTGNPGNGAVTYQYRLNANSAPFSDAVPTDASYLAYRVKATIAETANYKGGTAEATFKIEKKPVTVTGLSVSDKTYDGTTNATVTGTAAVDGKVGDDDITVTAGTAAFADKNVGEGKTVTFSGYSLSGTAAGNYTLSAQPASMTANITPKEVTVDGIAVSNKTFDGTTAATVDCSSATFTGVIDGDTVTINGVTGSFADANVGDGKTVTLNYTDATLGGADGGNYKLAATGKQADATANITKADAAAVPAINRTYLYTAGGSDSIDIAALLPPNRGTTTYTITKSSEVTFSADPAVTDGVLAYTVAPGDLNKTGTITVTAETQNYENITITVNIRQTALALYEKVGGVPEIRTCKKLTIGKSFTLVPGFVNDSVKNRRVVWDSSNPDVATVTQDGKVTGKSAGSAVITALSEENGELSAQCTVNVTEAVTGITLDKKSYTFGSGESVSLTASILPYTAIQNVVWSTDNAAAVIICDEEGNELPGEAKGKGKTYNVSSLQTVNVKATASGKAKITAGADDGSGKKAICSFMAGNPVPDYTISTKGGVSDLAVGKTLNISADWGDKESIPKNTGLTWKVETLDESGNAVSDDVPDVAAISAKGVLKGISEGRVRVTATSIANPNKSASTVVNVYVPVKKAALNMTAATLSMAGNGNGVTLSAAITSAVTGLAATGEELGKAPSVSYELAPEYSDTKNRNYEKTKRYSSYINVDPDTGEISVNAEAMKADNVTSLSNIKVNADVRAYNGYSRTLTCKVNVKAANALKGIRLNKSTLSVGEGNRAALTASLNPINPDGDTTVSWEVVSAKDAKGKQVSDPRTIATVDGSGTVTGVSCGKAVIRVTANGEAISRGKSTHPYATCTVTVTPSVTGIAFTNAEKLTADGLATGKTYTLKTKLILSGSGKAATTGLVWTSSDDRIATVTQKGVIKAVSPGEVTITATSVDDKAERSAESVSETFKTYAAVTGLKADKTKLVIGTYEGSMYGRVSIASVLPADATNQSISWTADNGKVRLAAIPAGTAASKGSFAEAGTPVTAKKGEVLAVKAVSPGVTKLTGITTDGSKKKVTCTVTVMGQVTQLGLRTVSTKNGLNDVTAADDPDTADVDYTGSMKANSSMTLTPLVDINGISAVTTDKTEKSLYKVYKRYTDTSVSYRSSDTSIATVNNGGRIKIANGVEKGHTVTIYVASADGKQRARITITVK